MVESVCFCFLHPHRHGPRDERHLLLDAEEEEEEEDGGEDPQSDGHEQHPSVRGVGPVVHTGDQHPLQEAHDLRRRVRVRNQNQNRSTGQQHLNRVSAECL